MPSVTVLSAGRTRGVAWMGVLIAVLLVQTHLAGATTFRKVTVECPICETKTAAHVVGSTFMSGMEPDGRPLGVGVDTTVAGMVMCTKCGFAAGSDRFGKPEGLDKQKVRTALAAVKSPALFLELDRAIAVESNWTNDPALLARLRLAAKWCADDTGEPELMRARCGEAINAHKAVLARGGLAAEEDAGIRYLIGELYLESGDRKQAVEYLTMAAKLVQGPMVWTVQGRLFRAQHDGKPIGDILAAARLSGEGGRIEAVSMLRESDDAQILVFLQEVCLKGPADDQLREAAMRSLLGDEPRRQHLPIFLEGLRNSHYRTVQACAMAVEALHAAEAAPVIVEALRQPVDSADYRLYCALAAVATEQQLDFLATQVDRIQQGRTAAERIAGHTMPADLLLAALLHTRSPKAMPHITRLLKVGRLMLYGRNDNALEDAIAFGPALLGQLPTLRTAVADDPVAVFKATALGVAKSPESVEELTSALNKDGEVAFTAAMSLARRGNNAGKALLIRQLDRVRHESDTSVEHLCRLLVPEDFETMSRAMARDKTALQNGIREAQAEAEATLRDPTVKESEKQSVRNRMELYQWNDDSFEREWLPLLAATRNPGARPICLRLLESPVAQTRAEAARALRYVYDASVREVLSQRIFVEDEWVKREMIETIGAAKDVRLVPVLLKVADQPTLAATKIAWMRVMLDLAPEAAAPIVTRYRVSPNRQLAAAAGRARSTP